MDHPQKRRRVFRQLMYALVAFLLAALLSISAFYGGVFFGLQLQPFAWGFVLLDLLITGYVTTLILEEEKLEAASRAQG